MGKVIEFPKVIESVELVLGWRIICNTSHELPWRAQRMGPGGLVVMGASTRPSLEHMIRTQHVAEQRRARRE